MSEFKVGDLVKISNPLNHFQKYKNTIHTVTNVDNRYVYLDIDDDCRDLVRYMDYELEHVNGFEEQVCAYQKATEYIDDDKIYERYIKGIW